MANEFEPLEDLAGAILDGRTVDWASAESSAGTPQREAVRQLRVLAGIAALHRSLGENTPGVEPTGPAPERWGRLDILEPIGRGSFGEVYRAWDSKLDREVAVKLLYTDGSRDEGETALREARLLARVRHQNVVIVYDADEIDGRVGLWMELLEGRTLEEILRERKRFDEGEVMRVGAELCRALSAVHEAGLLHRDVKAQNLMQTADGRLVLMDFGTGRELEHTTATLDAAGTPLYLAPEIFAGAPATVQTDIYSAGVLLFHLWTGGYPVRGANIREVQQAHARGQRVDLLAAAPRGTRTLAAVVRRAIEPDPSKRFRSAKEMLASVESALGRTAAQKRKRTWLALSVASVAVIAVAVYSGARQGKAGRGSESPGGRAAYFGSTAEKRSVRRPDYMIPGTPSPDGRLFPYSDLTGNLALYEFATGVNRTLTSDGDGGDVNFATESIVSADSGRVACSWLDASCDCYQLFVIDADGANRRVLYGERGAPEILPLEWSADDSQILGTRKASSGGTEIVLVSTGDGSVRPIRALAFGPAMVSLSPDGRFIAYDRAEDTTDTDRGIFIAATEGDQEIAVVTGPTYDSYPMWTPDGKGLVFASLRTGGPGVWLQRLEGVSADGQPRLLDKDMGPFAPYTLTRHGSLFYDHRTGLMDVYTAPIDPSTGDVIGEPTNAANRHLGSNISAEWSPDGDTLAFASWRTLFGPGGNILVFHSTTTGQERELDLGHTRAIGVRWSPDGRFIAVGGRLVDPSSGKIVSVVNAAYGSFDWDPDARHAYIRRKSGKTNTWQISRIDVRTGEEELVYQPPEKSVPGAISLSPDGRWLAHTIAMQTPKSAQLILIPTAGGQPRTLVDLPAEPVALGLGGWTRDGRRILFVRTTPDSERRHVGEVWAVPFEGGPPQSLGLSMGALRDVRVSPDGTQISFTAGYPDREMWVFENFLPPSLTAIAARTENLPNDSAAETNTKKQ